MGLPDLPANGLPPAQAFIRKWRERWPEWGIAEVFLPATQRPWVALWLSLVQELTHAAWAGRESAPGLAKLAWWQDELNGWAKGRRRHPLGEALLTQPLPWARLAYALNGLSVSREAVPENTTAAVDLMPLAQALIACEAVLFDDVRTPDADSHHPMLLDLLAEHALLRGDAQTATRLLTEHRTLPVIPQPRPRRIHSAIVIGRLRQLRTGQPTRPVPAWRSLLSAWRAARQAA